MNVRQLADGVYVTGQIQESDLAILAKNGIRTVVNNRPDGEEPGQPTAESIAAAAGKIGIEYVFYPVVSGRISEADVRGFADIRTALKKPALLYCRSGARCTELWNRSEDA